MKFSPDQVWALNEIIERHGYNGDLDVIRRPFYRRSGPIIVKYRDRDRRRKEKQISSSGNSSNLRFVP